MTRACFVTGALGCIGAWVVKDLLDRGETPVVFDLGDDPRRIRDLVGDQGVAAVRFVRGDLTDAEAVKVALANSGADRIVHLAGLQVPFCKADPPLGAAVNVLGTIHVFEAAKALGIQRVAYASSAAVYGPPEDAAAPPDEAADCEPTTHYGVYKRANEGSARIYFQDDGISSAGLRPLTVYGVGRDQGLTSGPTKAMKAAVLGCGFEIPFAGATDFNYAADVAAAFLAAAESGPTGARVYNLHGESATVAHVLDTIRELCPTAGTLACSGPELPIPPALDGGAFTRDYPQVRQTKLFDGIADTLERFAALQFAGKLRTAELEPQA